MKPAVLWVLTPCNLLGCASVSDDSDVPYIIRNEGGSRILWNV